MNKLSKNLSLVLFSILIGVSCYNKADNNHSNSTAQIKLDSNAVLTLVKPVIKEDSLSTIIKHLSLKNLQASGNLAEIRVWMESTGSDSGRVMILRRSIESWSSEAIFYKYNFDGDYNILSIDKRIVSSNPVTGWENFLKKLNNLNIYNLKNYDKIPGYSVCTDPDQLIIEVWSDNKYEYYEYPCLDSNAEEMAIPEAENVKNISLLLQDEFGYKINR